MLLLQRFTFVFLFLYSVGCAQLNILDSSSSATIVSDSSKVKSLMEKAGRAEQVDDIDQAKAYYEEMMAAGARSSIALNRYAVFLRKQFALDEAEAVYKKALKISPEDAVTHYNIGILYELYRGDFERAKTHYEAFQSHSTTADPKVKTWIVDLERRIKTAQSEKSS